MLFNIFKIYPVILRNNLSSLKILILLIRKYRPKIREDSDEVLRTTVKKYADHYKKHVEEPIRLAEKQDYQEKIARLPDVAE